MKIDKKIFLYDLKQLILKEINASNYARFKYEDLDIMFAITIFEDFMSLFENKFEGNFLKLIKQTDSYPSFLSMFNFKSKEQLDMVNSYL